MLANAATEGRNAEQRMSSGAKQKVVGVAGAADVRAVMFNLPNQLTWLRLLLSLVMFGMLAFALGYGHDRAIYVASLVMFAVAAGTDALDGYLARKYNLVTTLGRILDPFADKVFVCGTFIFLAAIPGSGVAAWMTVVIVGRELLVTALRSFLEQQGADFSATFSGKLKMILQCAAVALSLLSLAYLAGRTPDAALPAAFAWARDLSIYSAVALTVISGVAYVRTAVRLLRA
jgi:CDP-diacylglycerol---glycerol-3-phosphate 3-phosphatidyltransferase